MNRYTLGPIRIGKGNSYYIIRLPKEFGFLYGKKVYVTLEVWEPPEISVRNEG